jgi:cobalamin biosynthesis protein CobD/CbiB
MQIKYGLNSPAKSTGLLGKLVALVATVATIALVLMFSAVLFAVLLVVGTVAWAYLWWRTRELRKQMRAFAATTTEQQQGKTDGDDVFEGEVIREVHSRQTQ